MRISDWSSDVCSSDLTFTSKKKALEELSQLLARAGDLDAGDILGSLSAREKLGSTGLGHGVAIPHGRMAGVDDSIGAFIRLRHPLDYDAHRSEEHTSELQSLMRNSYAVFCLKKKITTQIVYTESK